jgi:hypothetical protein
VFTVSSLTLGYFWGIFGVEEHRDIRSNEKMSLKS